MRNSFLFSRHRIHDLSISADNLLIALPPVGVETARTVLAAVGTDHKISSAPGPQQIEGAVTEQTVEILRIRSRMAGKVFTFPVGEVGVFFVCGQAPQSFTEGGAHSIIDLFTKRKIKAGKVAAAVFSVDAPSKIC